MVLPYPVAPCVIAPDRSRVASDTLRQMRRPLCALLLALAVVACGDDDTSDESVVDAPSSSAPEADQDGGGDVVEAGDDGTGTDDSAGTGDADPGGATDDEPDTTVPTDDPAGEAPDGAASQDEGRDEPLVLVGDLTAGAAVPPPGDEGASGRVEIQAEGDGTLCVDMVVSGLDSEVSAAHIHQGATGTSGGVVVGIGVPTTTDGGTDTWQDVCVEVDPAVLERIESDPGAHYANIHTGDHPESAVRGQLQQASIFDLTLS